MATDVQLLEPASAETAASPTDTVRAAGRLPTRGGGYARMPYPATAADLSSVPTTGWRRVLADWIVVGGSTAVCHALGAVTGLLLRMLLDPAQMGVWQALKLFRSYGNYANLGISKGAAREFTVALGRGDTRAAQPALNLAFTVNTLTSLLYAGVLVSAGIWIGCRGGWAGSWALGLITVGGLAVLGRYVTFHVTILRSKQAFGTTSRLSILEAVLTLAICCLATWWWGLLGLYAGTLLVLLAGLLFVIRHRAVALGWAWDTAQILRLIAIGSPILLAGTVSTFFRSLDKLMILSYLSIAGPPGDAEFQLGCYSAALMVTAQLYGLGNMLSIVMGPRYGEKYGQSGDRREVAGLAARAIELQASAMALTAALAMVTAPPILIRLLPDYRTGLAPLAWLVPGVVALALAQPASQYLVAVNRQRRALIAVLLATAVTAVGNHLALVGGHGLVGVAVATTSGYVTYFLLTMGISIWIELDRAQRLRCVTMLALATAPTMLLAMFLEQLLPGEEANWPTTAAKTGAVALAWMLTVAVTWHYGRWGEAFRKQRK